MEPVITCTANVCVRHVANSGASDLAGLLLFVALLCFLGWMISRD